MNKIEDLLFEGIRTVGIAGHVKPDGDCVGSCTALWQYLRKTHPELQTDLYLEPFASEFMMLKGAREAMSEAPSDRVYDLFVVCDTSAPDRIGVAGGLFAMARHTAVIDHHTNTPVFSEMRHVEPEASSCAEVLAGLFDLSKADRSIAESLYLGIIHDTGILQYSNTSPRTLRTAARLLEFGIPFSRMIEETFSERTLTQNRIMGFVLERSEALLEGRFVLGYLTEEEMASYGASLMDLEMIVSQLKLTKGAEAAAFVYESSPGVFKVSLRSREPVDVAAIAARFGGGGHLRASGCTIAASVDQIRTMLTEAVREVLP